MLLSLRAIFATTAGRYLLASIASLAIIISAFIYGRKVGTSSGQQAAAVATTTEDRKDLEVKIAAAMRQAQEAEGRARAAELEAARERARAEGFAAAARAIALERARIREEVAHIPAAERPTEIRRTLNLEPGNSAAPFPTPDESAAILSCLRETPRLLEQLDRHSSEIAALREASQHDQQAIAALREEIAGKDAAIERLWQSYAVAYNAIPRKRRSVHCLWLWACTSAPRLPLTPPEQMRPRRTNTP